LPFLERRTYVDTRSVVVHELSIAQNIVEIVHQSVPEAELPGVRVVRMKVGTLSGVVTRSLDFCFSAITSDTSLAGARLEVVQVPFRVRCNSCNAEFENDIGFVVCPKCGGTDTTVISGRELQVSEIELDENGV
jgi:hydrogenase nickel incorporation protein HypA/HybF